MKTFSRTLDSLFAARRTASAAQFRPPMPCQATPASSGSRTRRLLAGDVTISVSDAAVIEGDVRYLYTDDLLPPDGSGLAAGRVIVVGSDERVYVGSQDTNSVKVFDETGIYFGELAAPGILDAGRAMAFGPDGRLYVAGNFSDNILAFDASDLTAPSTYEVFVAAGSGGLNGPMGLAFGPDGNLYVSSTTGGGGSVGPHEVLRFQGPAGTSPGASLPTPGNGGAVFVSDGAGNLSNPNGLAFGPDGALYVASTYRDEIVRYNGTNGAFIDSFVAAGSGGLDTPNFITFQNDGLLYVGSQSTHQVLRYNASDGSFHDVFVTTPIGPSGFALAASGDFYLSAGTGKGVLGSSVRRYRSMEAAEISVSLSCTLGNNSFCGIFNRKRYCIGRQRLLIRHWHYHLYPRRNDQDHPHSSFG